MAAVCFFFPLFNTPPNGPCFDLFRRVLTFVTKKYSGAGNSPSREIELDIEIGADARDWSSIQAQDKLKPVETDLRRIEEVVAEIVNEMEYLRQREQKLRDTNESTNERVKWFAFGTMGMLVGLGAWQVVYLRAYFRCVFFPFFLLLLVFFFSNTITDRSTLSRRNGIALLYNTYYGLVVSVRSVRALVFILLGIMEGMDGANSIHCICSLHVLHTMSTYHGWQGRKLDERFYPRDDINEIKRYYFLYSVCESNQLMIIICQ
jgi:hypothetical protein